MAGGREGGQENSKPERHHNIVGVVGNTPYVYRATSLDVVACGVCM